MENGDHSAITIAPIPWAWASGNTERFQNKGENQNSGLLLWITVLPLQPLYARLHAILGDVLLWQKKFSLLMTMWTP